jgi:hypothetical protein
MRRLHGGRVIHWLFEIAPDTLRVCLVAWGYSDSPSLFSYADLNYAQYRLLPLFVRPGVLRISE